MRLYELADAYRRLADYDLHADSTGSDVGFEVALSQLQDGIETKAQNIAALVRTLEAEATAYEAEQSRLKAERDVRLRKVERLKDYLKQNLEAAGFDSIKAGVFTVLIQTNPPSVNVAEGVTLPDVFVRVIPEQRVTDKRALLDLFKAGGELPEGVEIVRGNHLRIR
jgi:hypothetical protein